MMRKLLQQDAFAVYQFELTRQESRLPNAQAILNDLKARIDSHDIARFIAEFDRFSHTVGLARGEVAESILDARNIMFCFGSQLQNSDPLTMQPSCISIVEMTDGFSLTFIQSSIVEVNVTIEQWVLSLYNKAA